MSSDAEADTEGIYKGPDEAYAQPAVSGKRFRL